VEILLGVYVYAIYSITTYYCREMTLINQNRQLQGSLSLPVSDDLQFRDTPYSLTGKFHWKRTPTEKGKVYKPALPVEA